MGCPPEAEEGESRLSSSEGFLADDLGPDVNLKHSTKIFDTWYLTVKARVHHDGVESAVRLM